MITQGEGKKRTWTKQENYTTYVEKQKKTPVATQLRVRRLNGELNRKDRIDT